MFAAFALRPETNDKKHEIMEDTKNTPTEYSIIGDDGNE